MKEKIEKKSYTYTDKFVGLPIIKTCANITVIVLALI